MRNIDHIVSSVKVSPAPGLVVDRPLPSPQVEYISPFLMIDHFGPTTVPARENGGAGLSPHPHRGFETVTLLLDGAMEHRDSAGNHGVLRPGDVQWMTAARGILHAEYHEAEFARTGGSLHGLQLWINLPRRFKMSPPAYQDLNAARIPVVEERDATVRASVRVIAGEFGGIAGPARTFTPLLVLHVRLRAGAMLEVPVEGGEKSGWNALAYVIEGAAVARTPEGDVPLAARQMAVFARQGGALSLFSDAGAQVLILAGEPIDEPVASWGPFVMNTQQEILQARSDFSAGLMGRLEGVPY